VGDIFADIDASKVALMVAFAMIVLLARRKHLSQEKY
jgi:hypothetical protein